MGRQIRQLLAIELAEQFVEAVVALVHAVGHARSTIASRASTDWNTELVRTVVFPSRSSNVTVSIETWPGAPSNSKVCTMPSGDGSPWKTPWKPVRVAGVVGVDVPPRAAVAEVVAIDRHRVLPRSEPLREQVRLGERAVHELARRVELALGEDLRNARSRR